jgi:hypothetical protein
VAAKVAPAATVYLHMLAVVVVVLAAMAVLVAAVARVAMLDSHQLLELMDHRVSVAAVAAALAITNSII